MSCLTREDLGLITCEFQRSISTDRGSLSTSTDKGVLSISTEIGPCSCRSLSACLSCGFAERNSPVVGGMCCLIWTNIARIPASRSVLKMRKTLLRMEIKVFISLIYTPQVLAHALPAHPLATKLFDWRRFTVAGNLNMRANEILLGDGGRQTQQGRLDLGLRCNCGRAWANDLDC